MVYQKSLKLTEVWYKYWS